MQPKNKSREMVEIALEHQKKKKGMEHVHMALKKMEELGTPKLHSPRSQKFFASRKVGK